MKFEKKYKRREVDSEYILIFRYFMFFGNFYSGIIIYFL